MSQIQEAEFQIYKDITFISEDQIPTSAWIAAEKPVADVDPNDIAYVAFSIHFNTEIIVIPSDGYFRHANRAAGGRSARQALSGL